MVTAPQFSGRESGVEWAPSAVVGPAPWGGVYWMAAMWGGMTRLRCDWPSKRSATSSPSPSISSLHMRRTRRTSGIDGFWDVPLGGAEEGNSDLEELPPHLLCWPMLYVVVADVGQVLCCSRRLRSTVDTKFLWEHQALLCGVALPMSMEKTRADWIYPFTPWVEVDNYVEWKLLMRMNAQACRMPPVWVRVRDLDLRMPLMATHETAALLRDIAKVVRLDIAFSSRSAVADTACSHSLTLTGDGADCNAAAAAAAALANGGGATKGIATGGWPMRLRLLQWGGRPGAVIQTGPKAGARLLLDRRRACTANFSGVALTR